MMSGKKPAPLDGGAMNSSTLQTRPMSYQRSRNNSTGFNTDYVANHRGDGVGFSRLVSPFNSKTQPSIDWPAEYANSDQIQTDVTTTIQETNKLFVNGGGSHSLKLKSRLFNRGSCHGYPNNERVIPSSLFRSPIEISRYAESIIAGHRMEEAELRNDVQPANFLFSK